MSSFIGDDKLLSLPIPILHRIVTKYIQKLSKSGSDHSEQPPEFIEFLFRCINHFEKPASLMFEHVDFGSSSGEVIDRLLREYSEIFDFHFINKNQLKTVYALECEIIKREEKVTQLMDAMEGEIERLRGENQRFLQQQDNRDEQLNFFREQIDHLTEKVEQQNSLIEQLKSQIDEMKKPKISFHFLSESNPKGIISFLKEEVTLKAGGRINPSFPLSNIRIFDDKYFYNHNNFEPFSVAHSFIEFDFGPSKRVNLHSYFIQSNNGDQSYCHPKTWRINGANNKSNWTQLDRQENNENLRGCRKHCHFYCNNVQNGSENSFRFIRFIQDDSWKQNGPHYVEITYFELYGDIYIIE